MTCEEVDTVLFATRFRTCPAFLFSRYSLLLFLYHLIRLFRPYAILRGLSLGEELQNVCSIYLFLLRNIKMIVILQGSL